MTLRQVGLIVPGQWLDDESFEGKQDPPGESMRHRTITLLALAFVAMLHTAGADSQTPSELIANPDKLDGRHVRVKGYVIITTHERNMFNSKKGYMKADGICLGLYGSEFFDHPFRKKVAIVSGIFSKVLYAPGDICLYGCSSSGIDVDD